MNRSRSVFKACLLTALICTTPLAQGETLPYRSGVEFFYQIQEGDTPQTIKSELLRPDISWKHVALLNNLPADKTDISALKQLRMPVTWINQGEKYARVKAKTGNVKVNGEAATKDSVLTENGTIETDESGIVVILLPDGTEMTIAPSSKVRIDRLRQYFDGESIEARLKLERGEINSFTPHSGSGKFDKKKRDIRIQTPKATAAVRGTDFRVAATDGLASSGVLSGLVSWTDPTGQSSTSLNKGFGAAFSKTGEASGKEALLPAPVVLAPTAVQSKATVVIPFKPVPGASRYAVKIASNTAFKDVIQQYTTTDTEVTFNSARDGNHFVAVRALSPTGVEGYDGIGKVSFQARPFAPALNQPSNNSLGPFTDTVLRWASIKEATQYRVQLASDPRFNNILLDEKVTSPQFTFRPVGAKRIPVRHFWRVASMQNWTIGPFTDVRSFDLASAGPKPAVQTGDDNTVTMSWPPEPNAIDYLLNVDPVSPTASAASSLSTTKTYAVLSGFEPGVYEVSVTARFAKKMRSLVSQPIEVTIAPIIKKPKDYFGYGGELESEAGGKRVR